MGFLKVLLRRAKARFGSEPVRGPVLLCRDDNSQIDVVPVRVSFVLPDKWCLADWSTDVGGTDRTGFQANIEGDLSVADKLTVDVTRRSFCATPSLGGSSSLSWSDEAEACHHEERAGVAPGYATIAPWNAAGTLFDPSRACVAVDARLRYYLAPADAAATLEVSPWNPQWDDPFDAALPFDKLPQEPSPVIGSFSVTCLASGCTRFTRGEVVVHNGRGEVVVEYPFEGVDVRARTFALGPFGLDGKALAWRDGPYSVEARVRTGDRESKGVALATLVRALPRCHRCGAAVAKDEHSGALPTHADPCEVCTVGPVWYCTRCAPGRDLRTTSGAQTPLRADAPSEIFVNHPSTQAPCRYCKTVAQNDTRDCVAFAIVEALEAQPRLKAVINRTDPWYRGFRTTEGFLMTWLHWHNALFPGDRVPLLVVAFAALGRSLVGATALSSKARPLEADPRNGNLLGAMLLETHRGALAGSFTEDALRAALVTLRCDPIERYLKRTMSLSDAALQVRVAAKKLSLHATRVHDWMVGCHATEVWAARDDTQNTPTMTVGSTIAQTASRTRFTSDAALGDLTPAYVEWLTGPALSARDTTTLFADISDATLFEDGCSAHLMASRLRAFVAATKDDDIDEIDAKKKTLDTGERAPKIANDIEARPEITDAMLEEGKNALRRARDVEKAPRPPRIARDNKLAPGSYGVLAALEDLGCACAARCGRGRSECERWVFREVVRRLHACACLTG